MKWETQDWRHTTRRLGRATPHACCHSGVGEKRKSRCMAGSVHATLGVSCHQGNKTRRKCGKLEGGRGWRLCGLRVRAEAQGGVPEGIGGGTSVSASASASSAGENFASALSCVFQRGVLGSIWQVSPVITQGRQISF